MDYIDPSRRIGAATRFQTNARFYTSEDVRLLLRDIATAPLLAVIVHVDALERCALARIDRVMRFALGALTRANAQVVLASQDGRRALLHRELATAWWLDLRRGWTGEGDGGGRTWNGLADTVAYVRDRMAGVRIIGISDEPALLDALADHDRGIAIGAGSGYVRGNIAAPLEASLRAALWWLVEARTRQDAAPR